jgi:hypothetical protein
MINLLDFPRVRELMHLNPPEPDMEVGPGDVVVVHGKNGVDYDGLVLATDPYQNLALVQIYDPSCVRGVFKGWWEAAYIEKALTAEAISA